MLGVYDKHVEIHAFMQAYGVANPQDCPSGLTAAGLPLSVVQCQFWQQPEVVLVYACTESDHTAQVCLNTGRS